MGDIVRFGKPAGEPAKDDAPLPVAQGVIDALEFLMLEAKAGRATSLAAAVMHPSGSCCTIVTDTDNAPGLIGAVALLNHRILLSVENGEDE